jgi:hypothetical protein
MMGMPMVKMRDKRALGICSARPRVRVKKLIVIGHLEDGYLKIN